jgi:hypothetical protein
VPAESSNHDPNDPDSENHDLLTPLLEIGAMLDFRDWAAGQSAGIIQNANGVTIALVPCRSKPTQLFSCPGCFRAAQMDFETGGLSIHEDEIEIAIADLPTEQTGWLAGARDSAVGKTLGNDAQKSHASLDAYGSDKRSWDFAVRTC